MSVKHVWSFCKFQCIFRYSQIKQPSGVCQKDRDDHLGRRVDQTPYSQCKPDGKEKVLLKCRSTPLLVKSAEMSCRTSVPLAEEWSRLRSVHQHRSGVWRLRLWSEAWRGSVLGKDQNWRQTCEGSFKNLEITYQITKPIFFASDALIYFHEIFHQIFKWLLLVSYTDSVTFSCFRLNLCVKVSLIYSFCEKRQMCTVYHNSLVLNCDDKVLCYVLYTEYHDNHSVQYIGAYITILSYVWQQLISVHTVLSIGSCLMSSKQVQYSFWPRGGSVCTDF